MTPTEHKTWKLGPFYIGWDPPGMVSEEATWVIIHKCWMYGPWPKLWQCIHDLVFQWKDDHNLAG